MKPDNKHYAPLAFWLGLVAALVAGGLYFIFRTPNTAFYIAAALGILGLGGAVYLDPARARALFSGRQARYGGNAALLLLAFLGIFVLLNWFANQNPQRWDLSADATNTLAAESQSVLAELTEPVHIRAYYTATAQTGATNVRKLLDNYVLFSDGRFTYEFIDPQQDPVGAQADGIAQDRTLVITHGTRTELVTVATESEITSALIRLVSEARSVYFLTGHNEFDPAAINDPSYSQIVSQMRSRGYTVAPLNLLVDGVIPEDAALVVVAGPLTPLERREIALLDAYLGQGGSVFFLLEPSILTTLVAEDPLAAYLLEDWGIQLADDILVDRQTQSNFQAIAATYAPHPITDQMANVVTIYPTARSVRLAEVPEGFFTTELILTAAFDTAWGETDLEALRTQQPITADAEADIPGPVALAVAAQNPNTGGRVVVFGDADFASNQFQSVQLNGKMFLNAVDWAAQQEALISVNVPQPTQRFSVPPFPEYGYLVVLMSVCVLPGIFILSGAVVFFQRRKRG